MASTRLALTTLRLMWTDSLAWRRHFMCGTVFHHHRVTRAVLGALFVVGVPTVSAVAQSVDSSCYGSGGNVAPQCQTSTISGALHADRSEYMAAWCPPSAPYYWGGWRDSWSSGWHVITENVLGENSVGKADFLLSNTHWKQNNWSVTIGCSPVNQYGSCTNPGKATSDPGCTVSDSATECAQSDNCWQTWNEQCINNNVVSNYFCSNVLFFTQCYGCGN